MVLTLGNGQICLGTPPVVLQIILVFFRFRQMPLREKHSDIGEMTECFWQYVSEKI